MTYKQTIDYLFSQLPMYQRQGSSAMKKNLDNITALCENFNNPQENFPSIHIAGTNGKGTTSHILSSLLQQEGLTVGLYTSPHYKDFRERIKINSAYISEDDVIQFTKLVKDTIKDLSPSFFEITVAMAFHYFAQQDVDVAIIETGLGGRLDSTNIIKPRLSVITNIGYDHMNMLGDTLVEIAGEKAGIIKENTPVIIGERQEDIKHVFVNTAIARNALLSFAEDRCKVSLINTKLGLSSYEISINDNCNVQVNVALNGPFQKHNIQTAIASYISFLDSTEKESPKQQKVKRTSHQKLIDKIAEGLTRIIDNTNYQGRWQIQSTEPLVILDSAHNVDGINYITNELKKLNKPLHLVLGFVKDKNWQQLLSKFPSDSKYYFCTPQIPRGLPTSEFEPYVLDQNLDARFFNSVSEAKLKAIKSADKGDCVFIGGSTFVVAEAM
jgi:dihydrofolate synthase/folylpolyglutamate synthase